ncbi:haloacid dehalogenase-like hydrolase [Halosquirtibacter laminarini]|uniref:Haloacid dehalogenase-like hydrolase n=1 Tax=Halosquirtibacter laminarini TaxID=3374600 RepID=A0AC61NPP7_9BACT|nr:haloacid dehalogenase-like hydrolase [Prolixibacteraceae bacterium]
MNFRTRWTLLLAIIIVVLFWTNYTQDVDSESLESWNNTPLKKEILKFIQTASTSIPEEDRIAVFDLDGTLACEAPLWFEMEVAVAGLIDRLNNNPELEGKPIYEYARKLATNPADTSVHNNWVRKNANYLDSMILNAFDGKDCEWYVTYANKYLSTHKNKQYDILYKDMFYQPMLELINLLKENKFTIYIVSGSMQSLLWSICPEVLEIPRTHLIGTRQQLKPVYKNGRRPSFLFKNSKYTPHNNHSGKSINIYSRIGKIPVLAVGNTVGDFGMFHLASGSKYLNMSILINHDDSRREYSYPPYHGKAVPAWQDSLEINEWRRVDMSKEFKVLWMK